MNFGVAFVLGLLGSLHCAAMCGPLMLALPVPPGGPVRFVAGRLLYHLGRIVTYCLLGVVAGSAGKPLLLAGLQRWLSMGLGAAILIGFLLSKKIAAAALVVRLVTRLKKAMGAQLRQRSFASLATLGLLNGLLPCGLVYVAMAGAVSSGKAVAGAGYMAAFGLGTLPMLLAIGFLGKAFPAAWRLKLRGAIPVGVCLLAALLILRGLSLGIPYLSPDLSSGASACCHAP
ncbi:MAG TPA: sulfite exporter TauE/SafE family protein [Candidatus Acidoferrum sp.]|nr:sulfite exporter TauE/SafE family protein [Candidatus Acidoferrum sp.]